MGMVAAQVARHSHSRGCGCTCGCGLGHNHGPDRVVARVERRVRGLAAPRRRRVPHSARVVVPVTPAVTRTCVVRGVPTHVACSGHATDHSLRRSAVRRHHHHHVDVGTASSNNSSRQPTCRGSPRVTPSS